MVKRVVAILALAALLIASHVDAHRLDEYVVQTLIEVEPDHIGVDVDLTPGVAVAGRVVPFIDTDHDGTLTALEQAAYTEQVRRDLSLSMNGVALPLRVTETNYPTVDSMTHGLGTIAVTLAADPPPGGLRSGTLQFANRHDAADASYLVNCLLPRGPGVRVLSQRRSPDQATYEVEIAVDDVEGRPTIGKWLLGALAAAGALVVALAILALRTRRERSRLAPR